MHTRLAPLAALATSALFLAGCSAGTSDSSSSTTSASGTTEPATATAQQCLPVPGDSIVVLADDMMLQNSDNIVPAVNATTAEDGAVMAAVNTVSAALDTPTLIQLNKAVDIDRQTSAEVAAKFVTDEGLTAPMQGSGSTVVGSANFSENITVAEIYAAVLRDAGYDATVRTIGNRETYLPALVSGEVDVVPEYAATAAEFINRSLNGADAPAVASGDIAVTKAALDGFADFGVVFGEPAAAQDQNAFAVTTAFSDQYGVTSLSELAANCAGISLGGPPECPERTFCQIGLEEVYGLDVTDFSSLDAGGPLTKTALRQGEIAVGLVFSSDGELGA
ncbi:glycine betaine ABC transporter substrate-binding protein [Demequina sp.]|uniref:glycine betaine ABC transporter substrate-binding protein n=1 Tax=Demequina sp. TaxID=2050685 RepID=UPI0025C11D38|nr:glycine betaine ABC transporter substrate-binding protein [Demequina sp.]